jgi:N-acetyl-gamma-glutamyl-phosphate reductase
LQPHLLSLAGWVLAPTTTAEPADHDVIFLGLPHGQSAAIAAELPESTVITDCGANFRLTDSRAWKIHR